MVVRGGGTGEWAVVCNEYGGSVWGHQKNSGDSGDGCDYHTNVVNATEL